MAPVNHLADDLRSSLVHNLPVSLQPPCNADDVDTWRWNSKFLCKVYGKM